MIAVQSGRRGSTAVVAATVLALAGGAPPARAQMPMQNQGSVGKHLYKEHCAGCHKWDGSGGGGYGGAAASLRATHLDKSGMVNVVSCGVPGSGMPYHLRNAYTKAHPCYGSTSRESFGKDAPLKPNGFLRPMEIDRIVRYVLTTIKGRGKTTYGECRAFFGTHTRACDDYRKAAPG